MTVASDDFQRYAWFSVQVDQYYASVRVLARHHGALGAAYRQIPSRDDWPQDFSCLTEQARGFFLTAAMNLNDLGSTRIFDTAPYAQLGNLSEDMINFGFYTCFGFQWTLFENFLKNSVLGLADEKLLPEPACSKLRSLKYRTEQFLKYIDDGHVFKNSPFTAVLPLPGWVPKVEVCGYGDLNKIRILRNDFVHGIKDPGILPVSEIEKERLYERSMWILRKFAENVDTEVRDIRSAASAAREDGSD